MFFWTEHFSPCELYYSATGKKGRQNDSTRGASTGSSSSSARCSGPSTGSRKRKQAKAIVVPLSIAAHLTSDRLLRR